jgi:hypothetical protein
VLTVVDPGADAVSADWVEEEVSDEALVWRAGVVAGDADGGWG